MKLHVREYGTPRTGCPSLLLLHGLFGSAGNWHGIARRLETRFHLLVPDLRNHGRSPHDDTMDYPAMAGDVLVLMDRNGLESAVLVGHSMGAKAAMWLALAQPRRVAALVCADMAPVTYPARFWALLDALESLPLAALADRAEADRLLAGHLPSPDLRGYLLQNLVKADGAWTWRVNLPVLRRSLGAIGGFPPEAAGRQYPGRSYFIYGGRSDYVGPEQAQAIASHFPYARMRMIQNAGHWVYADAPDAFTAALEGFLGG